MSVIDQVLTKAQAAVPMQRQIQGHRAIGQRDGVPRAGPFRKFTLELAALITRPVIDAVGAQDGSNGSDFFLAEGRPWRKFGVEHVSP